MEIGALQKDPQNVPVAPVSTPPQIAAQNLELIQAVRSIDATEHFGMDSELTFTMDRKTLKPVIRVINSKTKELIQQLPPEYVLELAKRSASSG